MAGVPADDTSGVCPCGRPTGRHRYHVIGLCDLCCLLYKTGRPFGKYADHAKVGRGVAP